MATPPPLHLPTLGCGTWAWGNRLLWDYSPDMDQSLQQVFNTCVSNGITFFDTGDSYGTGRLNGRSESLLGQFSGAYSGSNADRVCLATKLAPYPWRLTRGAMVSAHEASAKRMGCVDLVQLHWSTANYFPWQENVLLDGLADLYEQGKVKGVGLSNFGPKRLRLACDRLSKRGVPIKTLQVQYSLLSTYPVSELGLKSVCDELGIQLIAYSPLCLGILTGKYAEDGPYPKGLRGLVFRRLLPKVRPVLQQLDSMAQQRGKTMAQVALNWCICKGTMPIPGAKNARQVEDNLGALGWTLTADEVGLLDEAIAQSEGAAVQNPFQSK
ncbi:MAG: aldo/keto reductase [Elainellaceae cyanobacterium]